MSDRDSVVERGAPPDRFSGIEALCDRGSRIEDFPAENRALANLAHELASNPRNVLQILVETALELCRADSAGISIFGSDGCSCHSGAGILARCLNRTESLFSDPCDILTDHRAPVLLQEFRQPVPAFPRYPSSGHGSTAIAVLRRGSARRLDMGCVPYGRSGSSTWKISAS